MSKQVEIKYRNADTPRLNLVNKSKSEWVDLYTSEEVTIKAFDSQLVDLGVAMKLPDGYEAIIAPRSSLFGKHHVILANSIGIIDEAYCGDEDYWKANLIAFKDTVIPAHTRILQFRIQPTMFTSGQDMNFKEVEHLDNVSRGGFGSTGDN